MQHIAVIKNAAPTKTLHYKKVLYIQLFIIFLCNYPLSSKQNLTNYNYYNEKANLYFGNDVAATIRCV